MKDKDKRARERNKKLIQLFKQKCIICDSKENLTYHHIDKSQKRAEANVLKNLSRSTPLIEEILKCVVLCRGCHNEVENKEKYGWK